MSDMAVRHLTRDQRELEQELAGLEAMLDELEQHVEWTAQAVEDLQLVLGRLERMIGRRVRKEDEVLFPALEAYFPRDVGPLAVLRGEHSDVLEILRLLRRCADAPAAGKGDVETARGVQLYGDTLVQIVRDHYYKEDRILFPMVARFLSPQPDAHLLEQMEAIDREKDFTGGAKSEPRPVWRGASSASPSSPGRDPSQTSSGPSAAGLRTSPSAASLRTRRTPMAIDLQDLIERLKLEVHVIEGGGYHPSVREPRAELRIFRDSVTCPNLGLREKVEPCTHCFLMEFVPPEHHDKDDACHYIPLNAAGDTVAALERTGNPEKTQAAVLAWLKSKIAELEKQTAWKAARRA